MFTMCRLIRVPQMRILRKSFAALVTLLVALLFCAGCGPTDDSGDASADGNADAASTTDGATPTPPGPIDLKQLTGEYPGGKLIEREPIGKVRCEKGGVRGVRYAPDGSLIYCYDRDVVYLLDPKTFEQSAAWEPTGERIRDLQLSRDGSTLLTQHDDNTVRVWDTQTGTVRTTFSGHSNRIVTLAASPDGKLVVSGEVDEINDPWVYVAWATATGEQKWTRPTAYRDPKPVAFSPDGKTVALWSQKGKKAIVLCDAETGSPQRELPVAASVLPIMLFSPDGQSLIVGRNVDDADYEAYHIASVNLADGRPRWIVSTHLRFIGDVRISPDGSLIGISGEDRGGDGDVFRVFNANDGSLRFSLAQPSSTDDYLDFSPDGSQLATIGFGGYVEVRDTSPAE
jgi:outer membrane protein assembly factor BamB